MINITLIESFVTFMILMPVCLLRTGFFFWKILVIKTSSPKKIIDVVQTKISDNDILCILLCVFYFNESFRLNQSRRCADKDFNFISSDLRP